MTKLLGKAISGGLQQGSAKVIKSNHNTVNHRPIDASEVDSERQRFISTVDHLIGDTKKILDDLTLAVEDKAILNSHIMIMEDPEFHKSIEKTLNDDLICLESALSKHFSYMINYFNNMEDDYFKQRANDYMDISQRMLFHLSGNSNDDFLNLKKGDIPILNDITPSKVIHLFNSGIKCFCSEHGSETSHSSILARSMGLTFVAGINGIQDKIYTDDELIVDGDKGFIIVNPDQETKAEYGELIRDKEARDSKLAELINLPAKTIDGSLISLSVNMEIPEELEYIKSINPDGIGLFRTEFLYLETEELPSEDKQFNIYKKVLLEMESKPVIIRTMDLGGDKFPSVDISEEDNPYLGCRGIRCSLKNPDIFKTQLRALLRAGVYGQLWVMFPMINDKNDFLRAMALVEEARKELVESNQSFTSEIKFGSMIEVPSAALTSSELAEVCDFFSIGSNDLIQYTVAVDRNNSTISEFYKPNHPAVLKLMEMTVKSAKEWGIPVSICGEMASNTAYCEMLLRMGFRSLSTNPVNQAKIKEAIRNINLSN